MQRTNTKSDNMIAQARQDIEFVPLEKDDDHRFVKSFTLDLQQEILKFFSEFGFVVIRDILTPLECQATVDEAFNILSTDSNGEFLRDDPTTWDLWPSSGMPKYGQVSKFPVFTTQALKNRQNPNLYKAFSMFFEPEQHLLVSHDRLCIYRPTKDIMYPDGSIKNAPRWKIPYNIHLDINPYQHASDNIQVIQDRWKALSYGHQLNQFITENNIGHSNYPCLQGVLNMVDNLEEDGGWIKVYNAWVEKNKQYLSTIDAPSVQFESSHWLNKYHRRITMRYALGLPSLPFRAGSIVIFDSRTAHGAGPNNSSNIRCAQFLKMFCVNDLNRCILPARTQTLSGIIKRNNFQQHLTPLGRSLFGLDMETNGRGGRPNNGQRNPGQDGQGGKGQRGRGGRGGGRVQGGGW